MPTDDSSQLEILNELDPGRLPDQELSSHLSELHLDSWGWALAVTGADHSEAEEVLQVTYLRILDGRARFQDKAQFKTWLFGVIRRVALERRRNSARENAREPLDGVIDPAEYPSAGPSPADDLARAQMSSRLRRSLEGLSERQRQILHLVFYQEMTIAEAAEVIGISFGSARTHYERGKKRLRGMLAEEH